MFIVTWQSTNYDDAGSGSTNNHNLHVHVQAKQIRSTNTNRNLIQLQASMNDQIENKHLNSDLNHDLNLDLDLDLDPEQNDKNKKIDPTRDSNAVASAPTDSTFDIHNGKLTKQMIDNEVEIAIKENNEKHQNHDQDNIEATEEKMNENNNKNEIFEPFNWNNLDFTFKNLKTCLVDSLKDVVEDLKLFHYKQTNSSLFQISAWSARAMELSIDKQYFKSDIRDYKLSEPFLILTSYLQHIGQANWNNKKLKKQNKKSEYKNTIKKNEYSTSAHIGSQYISGRKLYKTKDNKQININEILKTQCQLSEAQISILSIIVKLHSDISETLIKPFYKYPEILKNDKKKQKQFQSCASKFIERLTYSLRYEIKLYKWIQNDIKHLVRIIFMTHSAGIRGKSDKQTKITKQYRIENKLNIHKL
jgi:hypothetical protein